MPKSTPYWALLYELNVIPIKLVITYKRLMLYHNIVNSDDKRVIKGLVKEQEKSGYKYCWYGNVKEDGKKIGVEVNEETVKGKLKSKWKKEVKSKIGKVFEEEVERRKLESKKMRFLQKKAVDTYLQEVFNQDAVTAMMIRTNMIGWIDDNYGGNGRCPLCGEMDSTEHVFACEEIENEERVSVKNLEEGERMVEIVELFTRTEKKR